MICMMSRMLRKGVAHEDRGLVAKMIGGSGAATLP